MRAPVTRRWQICVIASVLGSHAGPALAQRQAGRAPAQADMPARVHVALFPDRGLNEPTRLALEADLVAGVREAGVAHVERTERSVVDPDEVSSALTRNDKAADEARRRMSELELGSALNVLDWAAEEYSTYLPELVARDGDPARLVEVFTLKAIAHHLNVEEDAAGEALRRALVLDPALEFDPSAFPPQFEGFFRRQKRIASAAGTSRLRIKAGSERPIVFVNGTERGRAPLTVRGLPIGPNLVHVRQPGAAPAMRVVQVRGRRNTVTFDVDVQPSELVGPLAGTRGDVGEERASQALHEAARELDVDGLVLALAREAPGGGVELTAYVYDLRSGDLVGRSDARVSGVYDRAAKTLGQAAIEGAAWRPLIDVSTPAVAERPPLWKRAYFWTAVGAAAAGVVVGVVVASQNSGLSNGQKIVLLPLMSF